MTENDHSVQAGVTHRQGMMLMADWDHILDAPDNSTLYCLTDQQVRALLVVAEYIGWPSRYYSTIGTTINKDDVDALRGGVVNALMTDKCTELLAKIQEVKDKIDHVETMITTLETDLDASQLAQDVAIAGVLSELTGIVEPSIVLLAAAVAGIAGQTTSILSGVNEIGADVDNIETVITDPTDGLAEVSEDVDNIELVVQKMKGQVTTIINNTNISINVGLPDQTFTSDSTDITDTANYARYNALCTAVVSWILLEGYDMIAILGGTVSDLNSVLALMAAAAQGFLYSLQNSSGPAYTATLVTAAMVDSAAVNDVACAMVTYLRYLPPTPYNFTQALSTYTPPAYPDHRKIIVDTLAIALANLNGFQVFSGLLGPSFDAAMAANPTTFNCPPCGSTPSSCVDTTWNFNLGEKTPWIFQRGVYQPGTGLLGTTYPGDNANYAFDAHIDFPGGCKITKFQFTWRVVGGGAGGNRLRIEWYKDVAGVMTLDNTSNLSADGTEQVLVNVNSPNNTIFYTRFRIMGNTAFYLGTSAQTLTWSYLKKAVLDVV